MIKYITTIVLVLLLPLVSYAGAPMDTVKDGVNRVISVAGDPALKGEASKQVKEDKIRAIVGEFFDFAVLSQLTLGRNWKKFKPDQQKEFVKLYRKLLENVYMGRILEYSDEKVEFAKEIMLSEKKAEVQSNVMTKSTEIPINYRLVLLNNKWKVYDVIIEGVSMVKNYRSQFNELLAKESPDNLLKTLREKVNKT